MKKKIWVYHKSYNGATYSYDTGYAKQGDPILDNIVVFNTEREAQEYAASFNCSVDRITGAVYSPDYRYISMMEIDIK